MTTGNILAAGGEEPPGQSAPPAKAGQDGSRIRAAIDPERDLVCCRLPLTDLGVAERWRVRFGGDFRFCAELGWFHWDTRRWALLTEEKESLPAELVHSFMVTVRAVRNEAALVAASGYETEGLSDKEYDEIERWAEAFVTADRNLYLKGDEDGSRAAWIEGLDSMNIVLSSGKNGGALWSQKIAGFAKACERGGMVAAVLKWIKGFPDVVIRPEALDEDKLAINVLNGTLRLERKSEKRSPDEIATGKSEWHSVWSVKLRPHARADLITKLAPVKWAPKARCPEYDKFIAVVQPDEHMRRFLHQWGGYSLTGDTTEHKLAFFYGQGRNGKGTWVEAVAHMAGDYAGSIGIESLIDTGGQRRGDQATPDTAELPGVRLLRVSEPQKGMTFNDGLLKQLTGGDPVKARHLNKGFFQFFPDFKLTISGNTRPRVKDVSHGMWARMQLVPWDVIIAEDAIDKGLPERLKGEASGILNRLIEGLLDWKREGLIIPEQVRTATREYRDSTDDLGRFLRDLCEVSGDLLRVRAPSGELNKLYNAWAAATGGAEWKPQGFRKAMEDKGFKSITSDGVKWQGVKIRDGVTIEGVTRGEWPRRVDVGEADGRGSGVEYGPVDDDYEGRGDDDELPPGWVL